MIHCTNRKHIYFSENVIFPVISLEYYVFITFFRQENFNSVFVNTNSWSRYEWYNKEFSNCSESVYNFYFLPKIRWLLENSQKDETLKKNSTWVDENLQ